MYDLEDQEEALEFLRKDLSNVFYIKYVNYALIGTTENSNEKNLTIKKMREEEFCQQMDLIYTGYAYYSFNKEQRWEFIKDCINKMVGDEIKKIKEERKRKEEKKREEEERKREEEEERKREEEERKRREEAGEIDYEDIEDFEDFEEGFDLENGGYYGYF